MAARCLAVARSGSRCNSPVVAGSAHCFLHSPETAAARQEACKKGGRGRSNAARAAKAMPATALTTDELLLTLSRIIAKAERGEIEPGVVNAISGAARTMGELRKSGEIEQRLAQLEAAAAGLDTTRWRA